MTYKAVQVGPDGLVTNAIVVEDYLPDGYIKVDFEVGIGQSFEDALYESKAGLIREERDKLLAATDWTANTDVTMSDEMRAYRQALRDIPQQAGFPDDVTWPEKP